MRARQHTRKHGIDQFEGLVNFFTHFGASQDNFAGDEDQEDNLGLHHSVDQTGEEFGLIRAKVVMARRQTLQANGELDVTRTDDVLDLEVGELGIETKLLDNTRILARRELRVILRLGTGNDHFAGSEDQRRGLGLTDTHDNCCETLRERKKDSSATLYPDAIISGKCGIYLWIVLSIARMQRDSLQIQTTVEVDGRDDVSLKEDIVQYFGTS